MPYQRFAGIQVGKSAQLRQLELFIEVALSTAGRGGVKDEEKCTDRQTTARTNTQDEINS